MDSQPVIDVEGSSLMNGGELSGTGRPPRLTNDVAASLLDSAEKGLPWHIAGLRAGCIAESTLRTWKKQGREDLDDGIDSREARLMTALAPAIGKWAAEEWEDLGDATEGPVVQAKRERLLIRFPQLSPKKHVKVDAQVGLSVEDQKLRDTLRGKLGG